MGAAITKSDEIAEKLRFAQNATGSVPSSFDSWLAHRGAKTLQLRMRQHGRSALRLARYLASKDGLVSEVIYPGLGGPENERIRRLAWTQLSKEAKMWIVYGDDDNDVDDEQIDIDLEEPPIDGFPYGGMLSFRLASTEDGAADRFLSALKVFTLAESLGGVESLAELPSRMTHASLTPEARAGTISFLNIIFLSSISNHLHYF